MLVRNISSVKFCNIGQMKQVVIFVVGIYQGKCLLHVTLHVFLIHYMLLISLSNIKANTPTFQSFIIPVFQDFITFQM